jgi:hypothetical protein
MAATLSPEICLPAAQTEESRGRMLELKYRFARSAQTSLGSLLRYTGRSQIDEREQIKQIKVLA